MAKYSALNLPRDLLGNPIPMNKNSRAFVGGRSVLDNIYGASSDPRIQANPPSRFRTANMGGYGMMNGNVYPRTFERNFTNQNNVPNNAVTPVIRKKPTPPNFKNNLLDFVVGDEGQALARGLLEDSGYSLMPKTLGESLAKGMGYMEQVKGNQLDKELKELQIKAAKKELETTATTKKEIKKLADGFLYYVDPTGKTPPERVDPSQVENTDEKDLKAEEKDFKQANDLRDEHTKNSGEFIKVRDAYGRILASGTNPSPAGDLALIFNYMKMLDPGSTVREGEFANAQNSGSIPDWIWARYNNVLEGTRLAPPQRKDFLDRSESLYDAAKDTQLFLDESYKDLAKEFNVDASKVVIDFDKPIREKKFKYKLETYSIDELLKLDISGFDERQKELYLSILDQKEKGLK